MIHWVGKFFLTMFLATLGPYFGNGDQNFIFQKSQFLAYFQNLFQKILLNRVEGAKRTLISFLFEMPNAIGRRQALFGDGLKTEKFGPFSVNS